MRCPPAPPDCALTISLAWKHADVAAVDGNADDAGGVAAGHSAAVGDPSHPRLLFLPRLAPPRDPAPPAPSIDSSLASSPGHGWPCPHLEGGS